MNILHFYFSLWYILKLKLKLKPNKENFEKTEKHQENEVNDEEFN
jgi:hypothetical protein